MFRYLHINLEQLGWIILVSIHFLLAYYSYYITVHYENTDYITFYKNALDYKIESWYLPRFGSDFFSFLNAPLVKTGIGFFLVSLFYSTLSFIPFYFVYKNYSYVFFEDGKFFQKFTLAILLFLPSTHFWLASFSKDALVFFLVFCLLFLINSLLKKLTFINLLIITIILFLTAGIRPYIAAILTLAVLSVKIVSYKNYKSVLFYFMLLLSGFIVYLLLGLYLKEYNILKMVDVFLNKLNFLNQYSKASGNAVIDLENRGLFFRFFNFMYFPLYYKTKTLHQIMVSTENLILLIWSIFFISFQLKNKIPKNLRTIEKISGVFGLLLWLFFTTYIYNYGLASRMKAMVIPFLFFFCINYIIQNKKVTFAL